MSPNNSSEVTVEDAATTVVMEELEEEAKDDTFPIKTDEVGRELSFKEMFLICEDSGNEVGSEDFEDEDEGFDDEGDDEDNEGEEEDEGF